MRYSFALALVAAVGIQAAPQASYSAVQPISQISDGQIQAPPATAVPSVPVEATTAVPTEVPATTEVPVETPAPSVTAPVVVPSVPAGNSSVPILSTGGLIPNGTVSTAAPSGTATGTGAPSEGTGAAALNMVSFGGLALAVAGVVLA